MGHHQDSLPPHNQVQKTYQKREPRSRPDNPYIYIYIIYIYYILSMAFWGGGMVFRLLPRTTPTAPSHLSAEEGIYDVAQPNVPKIIWTYWENIHQAIRTSIVTGCFVLSLVRLVGWEGNFQMRRIPKTFEADEEACCFWVQRKSRYTSNLVWHVRCLYHSDPSYVLAYTIVYYNRPAMVAVAKKCTYIYIYIHIIHVCICTKILQLSR